MQEIIKTTLGRICCLDTYEDVCNNLEFGSDFGDLHYGFTFNVESMKNFYSNPIIFSDCLVYGYFDKKENLKSVIWFNKGYDPRINKKLLTQFLWLSKSPKYSIRLLDESLKHINLYYKYNVLVMGRLEKYSKKLDNFYIKKNFLKDSKSYYKIITE
tara:strand:- start:636 stop:1106 length:471 start_codon:yes stop_codon:yes gene_type:complete